MRTVNRPNLHRALTNRLIVTLAVLSALVLSACKTTKYVPEDQYLLNKASVKVNTKEVDRDQLRNYLRQTQNSEVLGFWKMQLNIYSLSGSDTSKWINRQLRKIGEPPEIYSQMLTGASIDQLSRAMHNQGFFHAQVDTNVRVTAPKKVAVTYSIDAREPYYIRSYKTDFTESSLKRFAGSTRSLVKPGSRYDAETLDAERTRITSLMRRSGYYMFSKDFIHYVADSALRSNAVDLTLTLSDNIANSPDTIQKRLFTQYKIRNVNFVVDTLGSGKEAIRLGRLKRCCYIRSGELYNEGLVERTYSTINALAAVRYVDIAFTPASGDELDCTITVTRGKVNSVSADVEGTYSAGDWGVGAGVGYVNRNIFRGSEELAVNAKGSYEWRQNGGRAIEAKTDVSLTFPSSLKLTASYQFQNRPEEYTRTIAGGAVTYHYRKPRSKWYHSFSLLDVGYVYLPWISDNFRDYFLQNSNILKYSYEDHFIMSWGYQASYSSYNSLQPLRSYGSAVMSVETAGNLLYGISRLFNLPAAEDGTYSIFNIRFAQYAKADINLTYNQIFSKNHRLVYHAFVGVAVPFGNASSIPFEKRYFAGGANSVRGWTMRSLGPGSYKGTGERIDFNNQAGDIKLDLNLEYRIKIYKVLEAAAFTDAGNIWTIRNYDTQQGGLFSFSEFYKQIAWSYGVGIRLNFDYFVFRVDFGVKLYDPSRISEGKQWRTAPNGLSWKDDMTFHFAIGYPF